MSCKIHPFKVTPPPPSFFNHSPSPPQHQNTLCRLCLSKKKNNERLGVRQLRFVVRDWNGMEFGVKIPAINQRYLKANGADVDYRRLYAFYINYTIGF
ncbi:outer membrane beta-barrel protein [Helicobacter pylori]|uniref:outer membrane beta-barrel protein n=1 Tax=Helicobacter pylori TaxID=210 RepID=UPI0036F373D0